MSENGLIYFDNLGKYVKYRKDKRMSQAHIFMISQCVDWLYSSKGFRNAGGSHVSITVIKDFSIDKVYSDIYTPLFDIECETGLKHSYQDLRDRINNNPKTVIVVVPNEQVLKRYVKNCSVRKLHLFFCTLETFPHTVDIALRPFRNAKKN